MPSFEFEFFPNEWMDHGIGMGLRIVWWANGNDVWGLPSGWGVGGGGHVHPIWANQAWGLVN